ncbi:hypothetical protein B0H14DRAFT_2649962 [Mycena olivaceomarginata]|nr:hypothetical protein B0H14DRAFT_2649962 [Mycena olivaceomarginata]
MSCSSNTQEQTEREKLDENGVGLQMRQGRGRLHKQDRSAGVGRDGAQGGARREATPGWEGISRDVGRRAWVDVTGVEVSLCRINNITLRKGSWEWKWGRRRTVKTCSQCARWWLRLVLEAAEVAESSRSLGGITECRVPLHHGRRRCRLDAPQSMRMDMTTDVEERGSGGRDDSEAEVAGLELESGDAAVTMQARQLVDDICRKSRRRQVHHHHGQCGLRGRQEPAVILGWFWGHICTTRSVHSIGIRLQMGCKATGSVIFSAHSFEDVSGSVGGDSGDNVGQRGVLDGHDAPEIICNGTQQCGHNTAVPISALVNMSKFKSECWSVGNASPTHMRQHGGQWPARRMGVGMNTLLECMGHEFATHLWLAGRSNGEAGRIGSRIKLAFREERVQSRASYAKTKIDWTRQYSANQTFGSGRDDGESKLSTTNDILAWLEMLVRRRRVPRDGGGVQG